MKRQSIGKYFIYFMLSLIICGILYSAEADLQKNVLIDKSNIDTIKKSIKIARFSEVDKDYFRGGQPSDEDIKYLSLLGIKSIINLRLTEPDRDARQKKIAESYGMKYYSININPFIPPTQRQVDYFFGLLNNPKNIPVFIHCWHGEDRTGLMTGLYRIKKYKWGFDKTFKEMTSNGFHDRLFFMQTNFVKEYANKNKSLSNLKSKKQKI